MYSINKKLVLKGENKMNVMDQPNGVKVKYEDKVIMAGGTFIEGSTIELSADGPMREPYVAYMQGGLNYAHVKYVLKNIFEKVSK